MTNVTIHGKLGKIFGENHKFQVEKMSEVVNAIEANNRGFKNKILSDFLSHDNYYFIDLKTADKVYERPEKFLDSKPPEELHIVPAISGEGPLKAFFDLAVAFFKAGAGVVAKNEIIRNVGIAILVQGISRLLFPIEPPAARTMNQESAVDTSSYIFSSLKNNAVQGFPIPLLYGELRVGSNIISTNVVSEDLGVDDTQSQEASDDTSNVGGSTGGGGTGGSDQQGGSDSTTTPTTPTTPGGGEDDTPDPVVTVLTTNTPTVDQGSGTPRSLTTTDRTPTFTGNATMSDGSVQAGIIILVKNTAGGRGGSTTSDLGSTTTDEDGNFSITLGPFQPNTGGLELKFFAATDASDVTTYSSNTSVVLFVQSTVNSSPTTDPTNLRKTSSTAVARVTVTGNAEANSTVTMKKGSSTLATTTANANGVFTLTSTALANGVHALKFQAKAQGKEPSSVVTFNVTVNVPSPPADETTVDADDNIVIGDEGSTAGGNAEAGSSAEDAGNNLFEPGVNLISDQFDTTPTFQGNVSSFGSSFGANSVVQAILTTPGSMIAPSVSENVGEVPTDANGNFELTLSAIEPNRFFILNFFVYGDPTKGGGLELITFDNTGFGSFRIKSA